MDWDKLRTFYYVAKAGSFTSTAKILHITQPSISRQIISLENRIGIKLFTRRPRGLVLTDEGERLYKAVSKMIEEVAKVQSVISDDKKIAKGHVNIAATISIAGTWIMQYLPDFLDKNPELKVTIIGSDETLDLKSREADVAIRPAVTENPGKLTQRFLFSTHSSVWASKDYIKKYGEPKSLKDLDDHRIISYGDHTPHPYSSVDWLLTAGKRGSESREPYLRVNVAQGMLSAVKAGMGLALISDEYPGVHDDPDLVKVLADTKTPVVDFLYIYPSYLEKSKRATAFCDYLVEKINEDLGYNKKRGQVVDVD